MTIRFLMPDHQSHLQHPLLWQGPCSHKMFDPSATHRYNGAGMPSNPGANAVFNCAPAALMRSVIGCGGQAPSWGLSMGLILLPVHWVGHTLKKLHPKAGRNAPQFVFSLGISSPFGNGCVYAENGGIGNHATSPIFSRGSCRRPQWDFWQKRRRCSWRISTLLEPTGRLAFSPPLNWETLVILLAGSE